MKPTIHQDIAPTELAERLPPQFRDSHSLSLLPTTITAVVFPTSMAVVPSGQLRRALRHARSQYPVVVFAVNLTQEASALLATQGMTAVRTSDFFWTDATWEGVR